jgi:hypothetical protein
MQVILHFVFLLINLNRCVFKMVKIFLKYFCSYSSLCNFILSLLLYYIQISNSIPVR